MIRKLRPFFVVTNIEQIHTDRLQFLFEFRLNSAQTLFTTRKKIISRVCVILLLLFEFLYGAEIVV